MNNLDLHARARRLSLRSRRAHAQSLNSGQRRSQRLGRGMEFDRHRLYDAGDDIRHIDWNLTARTHSPYVKLFKEELEQQVLFVVDISRSQLFGSTAHYKAQYAAEIVMTLAQAATLEGDIVGGLTFANRIYYSAKPKRGREAIARLCQALSEPPTEPGSDMDLALSQLPWLLRGHARVVLISDFHCTLPIDTLKRLGKQHHITAMVLRDRHEDMLPEVGYVALQDIEEQTYGVFDSNDPHIREQWAQAIRQHDQYWQQACQQSRIDWHMVYTHVPVYPVLQKAFAKKTHSIRRVS